MARNVKTRIDGRAQYLTFTLSGVRVTAARYQLTYDRFSPWLITEGENVLPSGAIVRGKYLSRLFLKKLHKKSFWA